MDDVYLKNVNTLDDSQLDQLIRCYWDDVRNYIFLITRNQDLVDDLTQDTFIRAFRSLDAFRGEASFKTWLLKIARNVSVSHQRSAWIKRVIPVDRLSALGNSPSAESEFFLHSNFQYIWSKVFKLPAKLREVMILDAKYGLSVKEIASILQISEGTVKSRLNRARSKMSSWLEGGFIDG
ncbi:hypothetical protein SD71_04810 [Cohnella kolymensis]|uniref:RNA polymerase sigma factor n=1 Tax=Cohnella kolymensis TaxID=1590652 RepID=A0ABR5A8K7_9BACL|nr:sigma-70 family RNA polymerase sigma factor [Cohnella kolymensis]KIL37008.1 hypothetical protein SD71_04810 [Cohnella kolymensis]